MTPTIYYYPVSKNVVSTPNKEYARIKARKIMQRSLVLYMLSKEKIKRFRPKFNK